MNRFNIIPVVKFKQVLARTNHVYALNRSIFIPNHIDIHMNLGIDENNNSKLNKKSEIFFSEIETEEWFRDVYVRVFKFNDFIPYGLVYNKNDKSVYFDVSEFKFQVRKLVYN